jgi:hypothetical protein
MKQIKSRRNFTGLKFVIGAIVVGILGTFSQSVQAVEDFNNGGIKFDVDTVVEFEFVESNGAYQSTFGVLDVETGQKTPLLAEVKPSDNPQNVYTPTDYGHKTSKPDFHGSPGNTVPQPFAEFLFKANKRYVMYLESTYNGRPAGIVYSTNSKNLRSSQQGKFEGDVLGLANGGTILRWDDTGSELVKQPQDDRDFNDFVVRAGGHLACPYERKINR